MKPVASHKRAREIMGKNMFGIEEVIKYFNPTPRQIAALSEIRGPKGKLISEEKLQAKKDTHILVANIGFSILEFRDKVAPELIFNPSWSKCWYNKEFFAKECGKISWQLVRKTKVANSNYEDWTNQLLLLNKDEEVHTAQVVVYTIIGHYLATGECLFEHDSVRTSSVDSDGNHVTVGGGDGGIMIFQHDDLSHIDFLGVSSAQKF